MAVAFDPARRFVHLRDGGGAETMDAGPPFYRWSGAPRFDRWLGVFAFESDEDVHASMQEMHPEADEILYVVEGALDVLLEEDGLERRMPLDAGCAAIVPRGVWHRLVVREPGRLLFVNSRRGMRSRKAKAAGTR
jgi:mannose-6-phosphate isomerase-like protein (cupin superfamily)